MKRADWKFSPGAIHESDPITFHEGLMIERLVVFLFVPDDQL